MDYLQHFKHNMSIIDKILSRLAPYVCLQCGAEGELLCSRCTAGLLLMPERCYRCHDPSAGSLTCRSCLPQTFIRSVRVSTIYEGVAKDLAWKLKSSGARAAAALMAMQMALITGNEAELIVPVPTSADRVRQRSYDQAELLARQLALLTGVPWSRCLARQSRVHQVGAGREQRRRQLEEAFRVKSGGLIKGARILMVDDVVTTGATLESAARALKAAGARTIEAIVFTQPLTRTIK